MIAEVIVNMGGNDLLDYKIPESFDTNLSGRRVIVPLGSKEVLGLVYKTKPTSSLKKLKEVITVMDEKPVVSRELLDLHHYISDYYLTPLMRVTELSFPDSSKVKKTLEIIIKAQNSQLLLLSDKEKELVNIIKERKNSWFIIKSNPEMYSLFLKLVDNGFFEIKSNYSLPTSKTVEYLIKVNRSSEVKLRSGSKGEKLFNYLEEKEYTLLENLKMSSVYNSSTLRDLIKKGILTKEELREENYKNLITEDRIYKSITNLTSEQEEALNKIRKENKPSLLFGVTGSGKTEIYIQLIRDALKEGKSVLYMVPEISLISQTRERIMEKIDWEILSWHSNLAESEKNYSWEKMQKDTPFIILGARSSIFAPVKNLGLIIVDEEHETSYKQNEPDPRYNGVDTALKRGEFSGAKVVLGSATPALERYYKGLSGELQIVTLKKRPLSARMPKVEVVDLKEEFKKGNRSVFSVLLENRIRETLAKKEQVILFLNRRGFSRFILCRECGHVVTCPACSVPLIMHRSPDILKCHYCEKTGLIPVKCPECSSRFIKDMGMGTQKIESLLLETFPGVRVTRLDQDQVKTKNSYDELLEEFSSKKTDILLGTQMVVKGLDFSNVTLVGIISADLSLNVPDLYSSERTFQLLTQVAGRAGRGDLKGYVVIQTYNPDHFAITSAQNHNFESFYNQEIKQRKMMDYPPFTNLIRILVSGEDQRKTKEYTEKLFLKIKGNLVKEEILGPGEAPINKINNRYRYHFIIKTKDKFLHNYLKENYNKLKSEGQREGMRVLFDADPYLIL